MYQPEEIRDCVKGVDGTFLMVNGAPTFSDIDCDVNYVYNTLHYLRMYLDENFRASRIYVIGHNSDAVFYLEGEYTMGVRILKGTNIHLLHRTVEKMFNHLKFKSRNESSRENNDQRMKFFLAG